MRNASRLFTLFGLHNGVHRSSHTILFISPFRVLYAMTRMQCVGKELGCVRTFETRLSALNFVFTQKRFQSQGFHAHAFLTIFTSDSVTFSKSLSSYPRR